MEEKIFLPVGWSRRWSRPGTGREEKRRSPSANRKEKKRKRGELWLPPYQDEPSGGFPVLKRPAHAPGGVPFIKKSLLTGEEGGDQRKRKDFRKELRESPREERGGTTAYATKRISLTRAGTRKESLKGGGRRRRAPSGKRKEARRRCGKKKKTCAKAATSRTRKQKGARSGGSRPEGPRV